MIDKFLVHVFVNQWLVLFIVGLLLLAVAEIGFRAGLRLSITKDENRKGQIGSVQGAVLGLLGLLLGFTFAMAVGRFEARRSLVLEEANSIGTTYLRASFLPAAHRTPVEDLLRQYVETRLAFYQAGTDTAKRALVEAQSARIQHELWEHAVAAGTEAPTPLIATFVNSLNETIDLDAKRLNALRSHVPGAVWLLLLAVACVGSYTSGYGAGASGVRAQFSCLLLPLLVTVVVTLIADLDRPHNGVIGVSQQPLHDLKAGVAAPNK